MMRKSVAAACWLGMARLCGAEDPVGALDLDEALARQAASDLISGVASAYDCRIAERSFRRLGTDEQPVYLIEVAMYGPECEEALLLLARHGSTRHFVFRAWEPAPDIQEIDPGEQGD